MTEVYFIHMFEQGWEGCCTNNVLDFLSDVIIFRSNREDDATRQTAPPKMLKVSIYVLGGGGLGTICTASHLSPLVTFVPRTVVTSSLSYKPADCVSLRRRDGEEQEGK